MSDEMGSAIVQLFPPCLFSKPSGVSAIFWALLFENTLGEKQKHMVVKQVEGTDCLTPGVSSISWGPSPKQNCYLAVLWAIGF